MSSLLDDPELRALAEEFADEFDENDVGDLDDLEIPDDRSHRENKSAERDDVDGEESKGEISDGDVEGELKDLAGEIALECGGSAEHKGTESDDELAAFEAEQAEKPKKSLPSEPLKLSRSQSDSAAVKEEIAAAKSKAIQLKKAGKMSEALEALRIAKHLEQKLVMMERAETRAAPMLVSAQLLSQRLKEYQTAAVFANKNNRLDQAKEFLSVANNLKLLIKKFDSGEEVKTNEIPPPANQNEIAKPKSQPATAAAPAPSPSAVKPKPATAAAAATPTVSVSKSSAVVTADKRVSSSIRSELSFDALLDRLKSQVDSLAAEVKGILVAGRASDQSKALALQVNRWKVRSQTDFDLVSAARKKGFPCPSTKIEKVKLKEELKFDEIPEDAIRVEIKSAKELKAAKDSGLNPDELNSFVVCKLEFGGDSSDSAAPTFTSEVKKKSAAPLFNQSHDFRLDGRSKSTIRKIKLGKISFAVYHKRFLLSAIEVGHGDIKLKELMNKAELIESVKLRGSEARKAGELSIVIRVKKPFESPDIREVEKELTLVEEFYDGRQQQTNEAAESPKAEVKSADAVVEEKKTPSNPNESSSAPAPALALPAGVEPEDLTDPHRISNIFSNDALEAEIEHTQSNIASAQGEELEELRERLMAAQTQLTVLVTAVQNGNLSLDRYLEKLKESITHGQLVAVVLNQRGKKADAIAVLRRVNLIKKEVQTAEENREQLDE